MYEYVEFFNKDGDTLENELKSCILNYYNKHILMLSKWFWHLNKKWYNDLNYEMYGLYHF